MQNRPLRVLVAFILLVVREQGPVNTSWSSRYCVSKQLGRLCQETPLSTEGKKKKKKGTSGDTSPYLVNLLYVTHMCVEQATNRLNRSVGFFMSKERETHCEQPSLWC